MNWVTNNIVKRHTFIYYKDLVVTRRLVVFIYSDAHIFGEGNVGIKPLQR